MKIAAIWVYPIKSMAGLSLPSCRVAASGIPLDRSYLARDRETGKMLTAIRHPALLRLQPIVLDEVSEPRVLASGLFEENSQPAALVVRFPDGELIAVEDPRLEQREGRLVHSTAVVDNRQHHVRSGFGLSELLSRPVRLEHSREGNFDGNTIHLVTDGSLRFLRHRVGVPVRAENFRGNFQIAVSDTLIQSRDRKGAGSSQGFIEPAWVGRRLRLGAEVELMLERGCPRCVMATTDPLTLERNPNILQVLKAENEGNFGLYASVVRAGRVALGSEASLL